MSTSRHWAVDSAYSTPLPASPLADPWWLEVAAGSVAAMLLVALVAVVQVDLEQELDWL